MATAAFLLTDRVATGFANERLADVALRISRSNAHHLIVIHETDKTFVGLIKLSDIAGHHDPGNRILADLKSRSMPVMVGSNESASTVVEMFEQHRLGEAIVTKEGTYVGLITAESILQWKRRHRNFAVKTPSLEILSASRTTLEKTNVYPMVLLVEDHAPSRKALSSILARRKLTVIEAESMEEALKLFDQNVFALVISDVGLPGGSGFELMSQLRRQSNVHGISITAFADSVYRTQSKDAGFSYHFTKPLDVRTLSAAIWDLLGTDSAALGVQG